MQIVDHDSSEMSLKRFPTVKSSFGATGLSNSRRGLRVMRMLLISNAKESHQPEQALIVDKSLIVSASKF
jgi:hypothetical protein